MKYILFVDDEINILNSLKRSFYKNKGVWNMKFVSSGREAIDHMVNNRVDIMVTDMKMPDMNGVELLRTVQQRFPYIIRMALSGHADQELLVESIGLYHQYYTKPCDTIMLEEGINESFRLYDILRDNIAREIVTKARTLPVIPDIYIRIQQLLSDPETSIGDIAGMIEEDISLTTNILRLVNTPFFGLRSNIQDINHAVSLLGVDLIRNMILTVNVFEKSIVKIEGFSLYELMKHSVRVANFCKVIAKHEGVHDRELDKYFISGLLHDIGKVIFYNGYAEEYKKIISSISESVNSINKSEKINMGVTHSQTGAYLLGLWGFDKDIVYAVANHHGLMFDEYQESLLMNILMCANMLDHKLVRLNKHYVERELDYEIIDKLITRKKFESWTEVVRKCIESAKC